MNTLFYVGEKVVTYAFPQVGAAVTTIRYARTAYSVARASASVFSGDFVSVGFSLVSMAISYFTGPSIGPGIPNPGPSAEYLRCVNDCYRENRDGYVWMLTMCLAGCERYR